MISALLAEASFTENASRWVLVCACAISALQAAHMALKAPPIYEPHLLFIAAWSVVFGVGIMELAWPGSPIPANFLLEWINVAAVCTLLGWMHLVWRLVRE